MVSPVSPTTVAIDCAAIIALVIGARVVRQRGVRAVICLSAVAILLATPILGYSSGPGDLRLWIWPGQDLPDDVSVGSLFFGPGGIDGWRCRSTSSLENEGWPMSVVGRTSGPFGSMPIYANRPDVATTDDAHDRARLAIWNGSCFTVYGDFVMA